MTCSGATCERTEALLASRLEGVLAACDEDALCAHLNDCDDCAALATELAPLEAPVPVFPAVAPDLYELGPVIGHGGMGRIRLARDLRVGRQVAIKELLFNTEAMTARFVREARVAAQLQHPNIVPIYDVGSWSDGTPFYVMRLVEGRSLWRAFEAADALDQRVALLPAVIAAADAVSFAHARGVVHRDLSPANILLGEFGETVVIDWGLAKDLRMDVARVAPRYQTGLTQLVLTAQGDVVGSPAYMPREQAAGEPIDERVDIYALGAILFHLLAGRAPYVGRSPKDVIAQVRDAAPPPVDALAPGAPSVLVDIVAKAMARDPDTRHDSAKQLVGELRRFQASLLVEAHRTSLAKRLRRWLGGRASTTIS